MKGRLRFNYVESVTTKLPEEPILHIQVNPSEEEQLQIDPELMEMGWQKMRMTMMRRSA